jgi:hypothetical protein
MSEGLVGRRRAAWRVVSACLLSAAAAGVARADTQSGELTPTDALSRVRINRRADYYLLQGAGATTITLTGFDAYMYLYDQDLKQLDKDDDLAGNKGALLKVTLQSGRKYYVEATSYGAGVHSKYTLTSTLGTLTPTPDPWAGAPAPAKPRIVLLLHGMNTHYTTWNKFIESLPVNAQNKRPSMQRIFQGTRLGSVDKPVADKDGVLYYAVDFGYYDSSDGRVGAEPDAVSAILPLRSTAGCGDFAPVVKLGQEVNDAIENLRANLYPDMEIALVCHSRGGLAARAFLQSGAANIKYVVAMATVGSPHHGSPLARIYEYLTKNPRPVGTFIGIRDPRTGSSSMPSTGDGTTVKESLTTADAKSRLRPTCRADYYKLTTNRAGALDVVMTGADTCVAVYDSAWGTPQQHAGGATSRVQRPVKPSQTYYIEATTTKDGTVGAYTMTIGDGATWKEVKQLGPGSLLWSLDFGVDVRRPTIGDLAIGSAALASLNKAMPTNVKCGSVFVRGKRLGALYGLGGIEYDAYGGMSKAAQDHILGPGRTRESYDGDGIVPADSQVFPDASSSRPSTSSLYHIQEPGKSAADLKAALQQLGWWR